jgi:hypothetical protein
MGRSPVGLLPASVERVEELELNTSGSVPHLVTRNVRGCARKRQKEHDNGDTETTA